MKSSIYKTSKSCKGPVHWEQIASIFFVANNEYFIQIDSNGGISTFHAFS